MIKTTSAGRCAKGSINNAAGCDGDAGVDAGGEAGGGLEAARSPSVSVAVGVVEDVVAARNPKGQGMAGWLAVSRRPRRSSRDACS